MRNERLEHFIDLIRQSDDIKLMVRIVCDQEGVTSVGHLHDVNIDTFTELYEQAVAMATELEDI